MRLIGNRVRVPGDPSHCNADEAAIATALLKGREGAAEVEAEPGDLPSRSVLAVLHWAWRRVRLALRAMD